MMSFLCKICDRSIIEFESEYNNNLAALRKKKDKSLYNKFTIINVNFDEVNKILNDYISSHNKNFDFCLINCEFVLEFDNNFIAKIKTNYFYNTHFININRYVL